MKRAVLPVLALLAVVPSAPLQAQQTMNADPGIWGPRVRITPFVGQLPTVSRTERWIVFANGNPSFGDYDVDLGAGPAIGASAEFQVNGPFAMIVSGMYGSRGQTREFSFGDGEFLSGTGSNFLTAKVAAAWRLRETMTELQFRRLTATVFAGPAFIREMPKSDPTLPQALLDGVNHWAANFGVDAEIPLGSKPVSLQLGLEDYYTFWNADAYAARNDRVLTGSGVTTESYLDTDASHAILFRIGLTFWFH